MRIVHLQSEKLFNPYTQPVSNPLELKVAKRRNPVFGPLIALLTAACLACFLGYLFVQSPPDREPSAVISILVPGIVVYAWTLRVKCQFAIPAMAIVIALILMACFYLASDPTANERAIIILFALLSTPVVLGGGLDATCN